MFSMSYILAVATIFPVSPRRRRQNFRFLLQKVRRIGLHNISLVSGFRHLLLSSYIKKPRVSILLTGTSTLKDSTPHVTHRDSRTFSVITITTTWLVCTRPGSRVRSLSAPYTYFLPTHPSPVKYTYILITYSAICLLSHLKLIVGGTR